MKKVFTLNENALFTQIEKNLFNEVLKEKAIRPKKTTIDTILNYSVKPRASGNVNSIYFFI